jgi:imidazolonepropionase-like amidohydrolase
MEFIIRKPWRDTGCKFEIFGSQIIGLIVVALDLVFELVAALTAVVVNAARCCGVHR